MTDPINRAVLANALLREALAGPQDEDDEDIMDGLAHGATSVRVVAASNGFHWWCMTCDAQSKTFRTAGKARADGSWHDCDEMGDDSGDY